jgi:transcriptional regulator with XRE-family HTH domain
MELGEKLRQARLEAGLSQRALCGDVITRNMLSQIENGSAKPSMATLQYLAGQLGKTVGYFLEEQSLLSPNPGVMERAREAYAHRQHEAVLRSLSVYQGPDPLFDMEKDYLFALSALARAEEILSVAPDQAQGLLEQISRSSIYYTEAMEQGRRMLLHRAWQALEQYYREKEDYKQAYFYACKLRGI